MKVNGRLPVNLKLVIEGEEESGSDSLEGFLTQRRAELDADVIVVSDTAMLGPDQPALTYALRGMVYAQINGLSGAFNHLEKLGITTSGDTNNLTLEDASALDAALADRLPRLIEPGDIRGDLHMHTIASDGGNTIQERALEIMKDEFPDLAERVKLHLPDEKSRRVGQSIAAASLPAITKEKS